MEFANSVYAYRDSIYRIWLISPWIGMYTDGRTDPLQLMIDALRGRANYMLNVITRELSKRGLASRSTALIEGKYQAQSVLLQVAAHQALHS
jgi:hypothetical protein